jgi:hypothetical protein
MKHAKKTMRYMRAYFDLSSEEFWLHENAFIEERWWNIWKLGMFAAFNKTAFRSAWGTVTKDTVFEDKFINFVNQLPKPKYK